MTRRYWHGVSDYRINTGSKRAGAVTVLADNVMDAAAAAAAAPPPPPPPPRQLGAFGKLDRLTYHFGEDGSCGAVATTGWAGSWWEGGGETPRLSICRTTLGWWSVVFLTVKLFVTFVNYEREQSEWGHFVL